MRKPKSINHSLRQFLGVARTATCKCPYLNMLGLKNTFDYLDNFKCINDRHGPIITNPYAGGFGSIVLGPKDESLCILLDGNDLFAVRRFLSWLLLVYGGEALLIFV